MNIDPRHLLITPIGYVPIWATGSLTQGDGPGQPPDLLKSITDGYQNSVSPTYVSIAQANYTIGTGTKAGYKNYVGPMYVLNRATFSDPSNTGGTYYQTFSYSNAWMSLQGRGFSAFQVVKQYDSRNGLWESRGYDYYFPYTGNPVFDELTFDQAATQPIKYSFASNEQSLTLDGTANNQRYFTYNNTTTQIYQVSWSPSTGSSPGPLIETDTTNYTYDSNYGYGNPTNIVTTITDNDSSSPYHGQQWTTTTATTFAAPDTGSNWCLTLPARTTVSKTSPGSSITRTTAFNTPDYAHCRVNQVVIEPGNSTYAVTQDLGYDLFGNISTLNVTGAGMSARTWTTDWGATGQFPVTLRDPVSNALGASGYKAVRGYDYGLGLQTSEVVQSTDGSVNNAPAATRQYDSFGRKQRETRSDGTYTTWAYNDCATWVGCPVGSHALALVQTVHNTDGTVQTGGTTWFDPADRPVLANERMLASGAYSLTGVQYDNLGRIHFKQFPCGYSGSVAGCPNGTTMSYDVFGRVTQVQRPISATNTTLQTTTIQYSGRTTTTTDPYGKTSTRTTTVTGSLGVSQDHDRYLQTFTYDAFGSLLSVTDSLSNTLYAATYDYGLGAFQRDVTDMDLDLSNVVGQHRRYNYNALGELTSWTDAKGQSFVLTYDGLSRQLTRTEKLASGAVDLATSWTWGSTASNHDVGQLSVIAANSYMETFAYDSDARPLHKSVTIPSDATYVYDFAYNLTTGLLDTLTYPISTSSYQLKLAYGYQNGILARVSDANAGTIYWAANATNPRGQVNQETLGNGVVTNRVFDDVTGWQGKVTSGRSGAAEWQNESYLYDKMGNVMERQNNKVGLTEDFYYDDVYRLDHSTLNGTLNLQMGYNVAGNITSRSDLAAGATWNYDPIHKHAVTQAGDSAHSYTYDNNGNATSRNGLGITWTSYNHPLTINNSGSGESVQFAYNQNHERWSAVYTSPVGTETTYLIGNLLEKVILPGGANDFRHFIYAGGTKIAIYSRSTSGNTLYYVREDQQGGVDAILNSDGTCYAKESFTAFGLRRSACTWSGPPTNGSLTKINAVTRHGYTWQTVLGNMGLNDMNGRIQDAATGRFLSADPYIHDLSNTQDFNRYSYVRNNPLTYIDPSGFDICYTIHNDGGVGAGGEVIVEPGSQVCFPEPLFPWAPPPQTPGGGGGQIPCLPGVNCYVKPQKIDPYLAAAFDAALADKGCGGGGGGGGRGGLINLGRWGDNLTNLGLAAGTLDDSVARLAESSTVALGRAFGGSTVPGTLSPFNRAGFESIGSNAAEFLQNNSRIIAGGGYLLAGVSVFYNTAVGYRAGGVQGATIQAAAGTFNFAVDTALISTANVAGAAAAFGYEANGGILGLIDETDANNCLAPSSSNGVAVSPY